MPWVNIQLPLLHGVREGVGRRITTELIHKPLLPRLIADVDLPTKVALPDFLLLLVPKLVLVFLSLDLNLLLHVVGLAAETLGTHDTSAATG
jgi:hypothetical protein